jgi:hypothetical protein
VYVRMIYTGIGSRKTPDDILSKMGAAAKYLANQGLTLRSGGAPKADVAFITAAEKAKGKMEIYLPYDRFNGFTLEDDCVFGPPTKEARLLAKKFHPAWDNLGDVGRDFMGRNAYQVLGLDLQTPTKFILCWTPNGKITGGTGQALRMADHYDIPVLNFGSMSQEEIEEAIFSYL